MNAQILKWVYKNKFPVKMRSRKVKMESKVHAVKKQFSIQVSTQEKGFVF